MKILIKKGTIVTSTDIVKADILIDHEKVVALGKNLDYEAETIIDAEGKFIFPGGIDGHVHMNVPCADGSLSAGYDTETIAAAVGGTTTIIDYVLQESGKSLHESLNNARNLAQSQAAVDYGLHVIITDPSTDTLHEIGDLINEGITSFKLFMANDLQIDDAGLIKIMSEIGKHGGLACVHAENGAIISALQEEHRTQGLLEPYYHALSRPLVSETEAINRAIALAEMAKCPMLIAHVSNLEGVKRIAKAKDSRPVFIESCPHYLLLDDVVYKKGEYESAKYVISPPLRNVDEKHELWKGMRSDIDLISSDHNGFNYSSHKQLGRNDYTKIPNGGPGLEQRFSLMYDAFIKRGLTLNRFVDVISTNPAKIFGLYPEKGTITPGSDADLVIFDPTEKQIITTSGQKQASDYTPYEGIEIQGKVETVFLRGKVIVEKEGFVGREGYGTFIPRKGIHK